MEFILKAVIGGIIIATVSTVSERYPTIGAFILGIPLASFVSFVFLYYAGVDVQTFKTLSIQTIYFVLVSLLFFPIFVYALPAYGFWTAMLIGSAITSSLMFVLFRVLQCILNLKITGKKDLHQATQNGRQLILLGIV